MKLLEIIELLADTDKLDRLAGNRLNTKSRTAAGIAVELGQYHTVKLKPLVKLLRRVDRILAGHRIANKVDLVRRYRLGNVADLVHHIFIDMKPTSRIQHHNVEPILLGVLDAVPGNLDRVLDRLAVDRDIKLLA